MPWQKIGCTGANKTDTSGQRMWIEDHFPNLAAEGYEITSDPTDDYNCIAYAVGDTTACWSHIPGYRWPNASRTPSVDSLVELFKGLGFEICDDAHEEPGCEKVALYEKDGHWTHAAVQLPSGDWSSKLGPAEDIKHNSPESLCGESYGNVHCIMQRQRPGTEC